MRTVLSFMGENPKKIQAAACLLAFLVGFLTSFQAEAQTDQSITLMVHGGRLVRLPEEASNVFVADPEVADVQVPSPTSLYVLGKKTGRTNVYALDEEGEPIMAATVTVEHDLATANSLIRSEFPNADMSVRSIPGGLVVMGEVRSSQESQQAIEMLAAFITENERIINQLSVRAPNQVNLRVRVAEMSREVAKQLGFNWDSTLADGNFSFGFLTGQPGPATNPDLLVPRWTDGLNDVTGVIDALAREGVVSTLAEPNLTAVSGETASFLAGGEFPIPVAVDDEKLTIEFKKFGVALDFTPTVLSPERISLKVRPEVSEISQEFSIILDNIQIPGLQVRRAETTVELASGQSFAVAGLLDNRTQNGAAKLPGIGDLPILGPLFSSTQFQRNETELMIIVTPYIVEPMRVAQREIPTPVDGYRPATDTERFLQKRVGRPMPPPGRDGLVGEAGSRLIGEAGFYY